MRSHPSTLGCAGYCLLLVLAAGYPCEASIVGDDQCIACHERGVVSLGRTRSRSIDPARFTDSVHARRGISCTFCHEGITSIAVGKRVPHRLGIELNCSKCHPKENQEYKNSRHAEISKKKCCCCHDPHYSVPFHRISQQDRQKICLSCHESGDGHGWLPQKELHFTYLQCTSCHDLNAQIGMVFSIMDTSKPLGGAALDYKGLAPFMGPEKGGLAYTLDADGNGRLSAAEIADFIKKVQAKGVSGVSLQAKIVVLESTHNFTDRGERTRDCSLCHSSNAKFYSRLFLQIPEKGGAWRRLPVEKDILASPWHEAVVEPMYILGESKISRADLEDLIAAIKRIGFKWVDLIGCFIMVAALSACFFHMFLMSFTRKLREKLLQVDNPETLPAPIRAWHWVHGLCAILLLLTGVQLRLPDAVPLFANFLNSVNLHNLTGILLACDYIFWLAYHLWLGQFRHRLFVSLSGFVRDTVETAHYYGYLIFTGEEFPKSCQHYLVFDPVERCLYFTVMLVCLPIQISTGLLLMNMQGMMPVIRFLGGPRVVDATHLICAYLLVSFGVIHVYVHTLRKYRYARPLSRSPLQADIS